MKILKSQTGVIRTIADSGAIYDWGPAEDGVSESDHLATVQRETLLLEDTVTGETWTPIE